MWSCRGRRLVPLGALDGRSRVAKQRLLLFISIYELPTAWYFTFQSQFLSTRPLYFIIIIIIIIIIVMILFRILAPYKVRSTLYSRTKNRLFFLLGLIKAGWIERDEPQDPPHSPPHLCCEVLFWGSLLALPLFASFHSGSYVMGLIRFTHHLRVKPFRHSCAKFHLP